MSTIRPALKNSLAMACVAAFSATYFSHFPIPTLGTKILALLEFMVLMGAAGGIGLRLVSHLNLSCSSLEKTVFSLTLGWGILSSLMIALGLVGGWTPWILRTGVAIVFLFSVPPLMTLVAEWRKEDFKETGPLWTRIGLILTGFIALVLAWAPITYYDALVYHYSLPALYTQSHRWVGAPHFIYSAFPQTLEMLWTLGLLIHGDSVSNLIALNLSLLILLSLISFGKRFLTSPIGYIAAALLAMMPSFLLLSSGGYIESGLTLFSFITLYAVFRWHDDTTGKWLWVAGCCAGWAIGTKYTGVIPSALAGLLILRHPHRSWPRRFRDLAIFSGITLLVFSPWLIKNWHYVGNPVFPFFHHWGAQGRNPWQTQAAEGYFQGLVEYHPRSLLQLLSLAWDISMHGLSFGSGADVLGSLGWAPFFCFLPWLWIGQKPQRVVRWLLVYAMLFILPWAMTRPVLRFLMPLLPVLALLTAQAWAGGVHAQSVPVRWALRFFLGLFLISSISLFCIVTGVFSPWSVALGMTPRELYLSQKLNYYAAAQYINQHLPPSSVVYLFGDQRAYYYKRRVIFNTVFSPNWLILWSEQAPSAEALRQELRMQGITHILVNHSEMQRLSGYNHFVMSRESQWRWDEFQKSMTHPLYHDEHCDVLEIIFT